MDRHTSDTNSHDETVWFNLGENGCMAPREHYCSIGYRSQSLYIPESHETRSVTARSDANKLVHTSCTCSAAEQNIRTDRHVPTQEATEPSWINGSIDGQSIVFLICDSNILFEAHGQSSINSNIYTFSLHHPCACDDCILPNSQRLGPGSFILITFFITATTYFVVGSLYNKAVYSAEGIDILPHSVFWKTLPGLIKDGYLFFLTPCTGSRTEYTSYESL